MFSSQLKECEDALRSLRDEKKNLPPVPLVDNLLKELKRQSSRVREAADAAAEDLRQKIIKMEQFSEQQQILAKKIADARISSPIRPHR